MSVQDESIVPALQGRRPHFHARTLLALTQRWALLVVFGVVVAGFSFWIPEKFATTGNWQDILTSQPSAIFIAFGAMLVLTAGEFDLSLGATFGLSQYLVMQLVTTAHVSWPLAVALSVAAGALVGAVNAALVLGLRMNSFIATIGVATFLEGVLDWRSAGGAPIYSGAPPGLTDVARLKLAGVVLPVYYAAVAAVALWLLLEFTVFGRELRASGANRAAAVLSGLRTRAAVAFAFVAGGALAAIGGVLMTARLGAADATSGPGYLLPAYAAAFLGATTIRPGFFNVWGTVVAIFLVAVGITGLQLVGAQSWVTPVFNGLVLLVAVAVSNLAGRRRVAARSP